MSPGHSDLSLLHKIPKEASSGHNAAFLYSKTLDVSKVNEAHQVLFAQINRMLEYIPPTQGVQSQHIIRAAYQTGHVRGHALIPQSEYPSPVDFG